MRHYRDIIWKMAKGNTFLDEKKIRIKEDLIPQDPTDCQGDLKMIFSSFVMCMDIPHLLQIRPLLPNLLGKYQYSFFALGGSILKFG
jgi:hypothetical protein